MPYCVLKPGFFRPGIVIQERDDLAICLLKADIPLMRRAYRAGRDNPDLFLRFANRAVRQDNNLEIRKIQLPAFSDALF